MSRSAYADFLWASIRDSQPTLEGKVVSPPSLLRSGSGGQTLYACDVELTGVFAPDPAGSPAEVTAARILKTVPIALAHNSLWMAQLGMFVTLRRNRGSSIPFEIIGSAKTGPGEHWHRAVDVAAGTGAPAVDFSVSVRIITLGEVGTLGGFGIVPLEARALYVGGVFVAFV